MADWPGRAGPGPRSALDPQPPWAGAGLACGACAAACGGGDDSPGAGETAAAWEGWRATRSDTRPVRVDPPPEPGPAASVQPRRSGSGRHLSRAAPKWLYI